MASLPDDTILSGEDGSVSAGGGLWGFRSSDDIEERFLDYSDLVDSYDTVIEVYDGSQVVSGDEVVGMTGDVLMPSDDAYDSRGQSLDELREELNGDTLVMAFGFSGEDLPDYVQLQDEDMDSRGNWWDRPEELGADYLLDRKTYSGAVDVNGFESRHWMKTGGFNEEVYLIEES